MERSVHQVQILIIDEYPLFRRGIRGSLEEERDLVVVGEAAAGQEGIRLSDVLVPDVVLLDLNLPDMSGLEATRALKRRHPQMGVIVLTTREEDEQLFSAIRAGANAYTGKQVEVGALLELVRRVGRGEYLINDSLLQHPFVAARVLDQFRELARSEDVPVNAFSPLTPREIEVLQGIAQGHSNKEIAQLLSISDQTVKNHITSILRKLAVNDRTQAAIQAVRRGWIALPGARAREEVAGHEPATATDLAPGVADA